jgi:hypothetical protein
MVVGKCIFTKRTQVFGCSKCKKSNGSSVKNGFSGGKTFSKKCQNEPKIRFYPVNPTIENQTKSNQIKPIFVIGR